MAERKVEIRYEVDSGAEGEAQVAELAKAIEDLGGDATETKTKADALAATLREQENQAAAVDAFQSLSSEVEKLGAKLDKSQASLDKAAAKQKDYADQVLASGPPTKDQADKLEKLAAKEDAARVAVEKLKGALALKSAALSELGGTLQKAGIGTDNLGKAETELGAKVAVSKRELNEQVAALVKMRGELDGTTPAVKKTGDVFDSLKGKLLGLAAGAASFAAIKSGITSVIDAGSRLEGFRNQLSNVFGSAAEGEKVLVALRGLSKEVPQSLDELVDASTRLKRVGIDPLDGSLQSLIDANAKLGRSNADLIPLVDKVADAYAKGKLEQRDIVNLQKEGVPVLELLTKATGKSATELERMAQQGLLGRGAIQALVAELGKGAIGAAGEDMGQLATRITKAKEAFQEFLGQVAEAGPLDFLKGQLQEVTGQLDKTSGSAKALGATLTGVFVGVNLAFNTVRASFNVLTATIGTGIAGVVFSLSLWKLALSKITFGDLSKSFKKEADELKLISQDLLRGAGQDLNDIGDAWRSTGAALGSAVDGATPKIDAAAAATAGLKKTTEEAAAAATAASTAHVTAAEQIAQANANQAATLDAITASITDLDKVYQQAQADGKTAADSVAAVFASADRATPAGLVGLATEIQKIAVEGKASGDAIRDGLGSELKKLTDQQLRDFQTQTQASLQVIQAFANNGGTLLRELLREEFRRLGLDLEEVDTHIDATTKKFIAGFTDVANNAKASGAEIKAAFVAALDTADTREELQKLKDAVEKIKVEGFDTAKAVDLVAERIKALGAGSKDITALEAAFRTLGVTSGDALTLAAVKAKQAFDTIKNDGSVSADLVQKAFIAMAEKALAAGEAAGKYALANAEAMLKAQVSTGDQAKALEELIAKYHKVGDAAKDAGDKAKEAADKAAEAARKAAEEADRKSNESFANRGVLIGSAVPDLLSDAQKKRVEDLLAALQKVQAQMAGNTTAIASEINFVTAEIRRIDDAAIRASQGVGRLGDSLRDAAAAAAGVPGGTKNPFTRGQPAPAPTPISPSPTAPAPSSTPSTIIVNLDGQTIFRLLANENNVRQILVPILQRYLALTR